MIMEIIILICFIGLIIGCFSKDNKTRSNSQQQLSKQVGKALWRLFR